MMDKVANSNQPLCIDCKHCINTQNTLLRWVGVEPSSYQLQCAKSQYRNNNDLFLLTQNQQEKELKISYGYCHSFRKYGECDAQGKLFEKGDYIKKPNNQIMFVATIALLIYLALLVSIVDFISL